MFIQSFVIVITVCVSFAYHKPNVQKGVTANISKQLLNTPKQSVKTEIKLVIVVFWGDASSQDLFSIP